MQGQDQTPTVEYPLNVFFLAIVEQGSAGAAKLSEEDEAAVAVSYLPVLGVGEEVEGEADEVDERRQWQGHERGRVATAYVVVANDGRRVERAGEAEKGATAVGDGAAPPPASACHADEPK